MFEIWLAPGALPKRCWLSPPTLFGTKPARLRLQHALHQALEEQALGERERDDAGGDDDHVDRGDAGPGPLAHAAGARCARRPEAMEGSLCPVLPAEAVDARELGDVRGH